MNGDRVMVNLLNGRLPATMLTPAYGNSQQRIRKGAAASGFMRLSQRSHAKGFGLIQITDGYRPYATSEKLFLAHYVPKRLLNGRRFYDSWWWKGETWCRISGTARIAPPGDSNHGWGLAVDLAEPYATLGPKHSWLEQRAPFYGFWWEGQGFGEPWHWLSRNAFPARPVLHRGTTGDAVIAWQCVLRYDLHLPATVMQLDGIAGPVFDKYTRQWQRERKLVADSIVGPASWKKAGLA